MLDNAGDYLLAGVACLVAIWLLKELLKAPKKNVITSKPLLDFDSIFDEVFALDKELVGNADKVPNYVETSTMAVACKKISDWVWGEDDHIYAVTETWGSARPVFIAFPHNHIHTESLIYVGFKESFIAHKNLLSSVEFEDDDWKKPVKAPDKVTSRTCKCARCE